ncbi:putative gnat family protein [Eutypa lata UCREL1]|uniref:Putative gnat family protein n=1 Tax=Eutypa lata (strain UCR-EL1) TaxID=1287681 RepID=M7T116_EUTLA|nr:putative gnat family protein [Eutypa lata UCREL1]
MSLELQDIDPEVDFPALARCMLEAYEDPPQKFLHIFFPVHGPGAGAREAAIEEAAARLKMWHTHDPSSHWQKVVDVKTGKLAGAAAWNIHETNPFAEPHTLEVTWFPDDNLFNVFTHPDYRRRGVGQQVMDWGMKKADELGLEFFLDATPPGRPLYEANGFIYAEENVTAPTTDNPDERWKETEEKVGPFTFWLMWRPAGGRYEEGKTIKPWET